MNDHSSFTAQLPSVANRANRSLANEEWAQAIKAGRDLQVIGKVVEEYAQRMMQEVREP